MVLVRDPSTVPLPKTIRSTLISFKKSFNFNSMLTFLPDTDRRNRSVRFHPRSYPLCVWRPQGDVLDPTLFRGVWGASLHCTETDQVQCELIYIILCYTLRLTWLQNYMCNIIHLFDIILWMMWSFWLSVKDTTRNISSTKQSVQSSLYLTCVIPL